MTRKEMFAEVKEVLVGAEASEELVAFVEKEMAKASKKAGPSAKEVAAREAFREELVEAMEAGVEYTATAAGKLVDASCQKAVAALKVLVADGLVVKTEDKKGSTYRLA